MQIKVYVVGPSIGYARWINNCRIVSKLSEADIVFYTGGSDVDPSIYNCEKHPFVWSDLERDRYELEIWSKISPNQLVWGTCRGFQLINVLYGGILVQNCENHWCSGEHTITNGVNIFRTTSLHHQMIYPWDLPKEDYEILYWSDPSRSSIYEGDKVNISKIKVEPEVAIWHRSGLPTCLGVQGHPEMMNKYSDFVVMLNNLIKNYL